MKKLLALTLIVALCCTITITALANPDNDGDFVATDLTFGVNVIVEVIKLNGNMNGLTIQIEFEGDIIAEKYFRINKNSAGEFDVDGFKVYVSTYGNDKIDVCLLTEARCPEHILECVFDYDLDSYIYCCTRENCDYYELMVNGDLLRVKNEDFRLSLSISPFHRIPRWNPGVDSTFYYPAFCSNPTALNTASSWSGTARAKTWLADQQIFVEAGSTEAFIRLGTYKNEYLQYNYLPLLTAIVCGDSSLQCAKNTIIPPSIQLGLPINVEINLFSKYGDVQGQPGPDFSQWPTVQALMPEGKQWHQCTIEEMCAMAYEYGQVIADELISIPGININVWDIGNEVNLGFGGVAIQPRPGFQEGTGNSRGNPELGRNWYRAPDAVNPVLGQTTFEQWVFMSEYEKIEFCEEHLWPYQFPLMKAVADGIQVVVPDATFSTHITWIEQKEFALAWYSALIESGFPIDIAGISLYPSAGGTTTAQADEAYAMSKETMRAIVTELGLPVFVSECGYPSEMPSAAWSDFRTPLTGFPFTLQGQEDQLEDLISWGMENGVVGIRPWCADLAKGDWNAFAFFHNRGDSNNCYAKPVMDVMKDFLANRVY